VNILKKIGSFCIAISLIFFLSCSKELHFSGISENSINQVTQNYLSQDYSKDDIAKIIGAPLIKENSGNLWIYRLAKEKGNATFKKTIYNKTLKLKFENNILRSVEEVYLD
tara:strand:+ start:65 stop:397 length:333 start_codon:yes stop_codon:yes gene_type:complete